MLNISDFHLEQIKEYRKFFKHKRDIQLQEITNLFEDERESKLNGEQVLTTEDVEGLLSGLLEAVKTRVKEELELTVDISVVAIQQLFEDADAQDLELQLDTSKIEDARLVEEVRNMAVIDAPSTNAKKKTGRLTSLRDEHQRLVDNLNELQIKHDNLEQNYDQALEERASLQRQVNEMQDQLAKANDQVSNLSFGIESLHRKLESANNTAKIAQESKAEAEAKLFASQPDTLLTLQELLDGERQVASQLRAELEDARQILQDRGIDFEKFCQNVRNSRQFKELMKQLQRKRDEIDHLRQRVLIYEPDRTEQDNDSTRRGITNPKQRHHHK